MTPDSPGAPGPELAHSHGTARVPAPLGVGQRCWIQRFEQEQIEATEESRRTVTKSEVTNDGKRTPWSFQFRYSSFPLFPPLPPVERLLRVRISPNRAQPGRNRIRRLFAGSRKVIDVVYDEPLDRVRVITTFCK